MLNSTLTNLIHGQKVFQLSSDCYIDKIYELFEHANSQLFVVVSCPFVDTNGGRARLFMLLEFRSDENQAIGRFTISWSFLSRLLAMRPYLTSIFRVHVDAKQLAGVCDVANVMAAMKETFGNRASLGRFCE